MVADPGVLSLSPCFFAGISNTPPLLSLLPSGGTIRGGSFLSTNNFKSQRLVNFCRIRSKFAGYFFCRKLWAPRISWPNPIIVHHKCFNLLPFPGKNVKFIIWRNVFSLLFEPTGGLSVALKRDIPQGVSSKSHGNNSDKNIDLQMRVTVATGRKSEASKPGLSGQVYLPTVG